jgi:Domain of unknown function (DUF4388)
MDSHSGTVDQAVDQAVDRLSIAGSSADPVGYRAAPAMSRLSTSTPYEGMSTLGRVEPSDEAPAASLVGSLSVFALSDVLAMLSTTTQTGELQVVGESVDGRVWLDRGKLSSAQVGAAATITQAVFDLACLAEGWFYFTSGPASSNGQPPVSVDAVLGEVGLQVDEWKRLREEVPLDAVVALCPEPPGDDVQIRGDQWRILTTIGNSGQKVRAILDAIGGDQVVSLRTLRDLQSARLIQVDVPDLSVIGAARSPGGPSDNGLVAGHPSNGAGAGAQVPDSSGPDSPTDRVEPFEGLAEVAIMPPPIASDPWAPTAPATDSDDDDGAA